MDDLNRDLDLIFLQREYGMTDEEAQAEIALRGSIDLEEEERIVTLLEEVHHQGGRNFDTALSVSFVRDVIDDADTLEKCMTYNLIGLCRGYIMLTTLGMKRIRNAREE